MFPAAGAAAGGYSFIRYKFASANYFDTIHCEGPSMPLWELRDEIISAKRLGRLADCDIHLFDEQTKEEYLDDNHCIPRNSLVIVKRLPKSINVGPTNRGPGGGRARNMAMMHESVPFNSNLGPQQQHHLPTPTPTDMVEQRPILSAGLSTYLPPRGRGPYTSNVPSYFGDVHKTPGHAGEFWIVPVERLFYYPHLFRAEKFTTRKPQQTPPSTHQPSGRIPHPNYICYRCGSKDHYISDCTYGMVLSADGKLQPMQMMKRVTGIPKTFLEQAKGEESSSAHLETKKRMISYDGSMVYFAPNTREWDKFSSMAAGEGEEPSFAEADEDLGH